MVLSLDEVHFGVWGSVVAMDTTQELTQRLRAFGLIPGTWVRRRYCSPGGDVTAVELRGSVIALRTGDVRRIRVEVE